jgi:hypothetical protein
VRTIPISGFLLLIATAAGAKEVDRVCRNDDCSFLSVEQGVVLLRDSSRSLKLGAYVRTAQPLVPHYEAPIKSLRSPRGWHIVIGAFLYHSDQGEAGLRIRFFEPNGKLQATRPVLMALEQLQLGHLFGGDDDILAITTNEEHSYNSTTDIWLLPEGGVPKRLFDGNATFELLPATDRGIRINRQTYDGEHAETKGWKAEFWLWDPAGKVLRRK